MQTASERFSQTMDLNVMFVCLLTPAGEKYSGAIE
jgi:hypothetical protein